MSSLKQALNELAEELKQRIRRDTKTSNLVASGEFLQGWDTEATEDSIILINRSDHAGAALTGNPANPTARPPSSREISRWMMQKKIRPYRKLKNGMARFVSPTDKAYNRAGFAIAKGIRKNGSIKRFRNRPSNLVQDVYKSMERKIGVKIAESYKEDVEKEIRRILKTNFNGTNIS